MAGAEHLEVAMVQGCQFGFVKAPHYREYGGVHESDVGIVVAGTKLANPPVVSGLGFFQTVGSRLGCAIVIVRTAADTTNPKPECWAIIKMHPQSVDRASKEKLQCHQG